MTSISSLKNESSVNETSLGVKIFHSPNPFEFEKGEKISSLTLAFETYGQLSTEKNNVILIHHALSTSSHVASHEKNPAPGWWEAVVGPQKAINTDKFFVICINNLGSCFGSSGPASINSETGNLYRQDFPFITIADMVRAQWLLLEYLGIEKIYAVIGNSMGAMLSLTASILFANKIEKLISVSSCYRAYPVSIATHEIQRQIIALDPAWKKGNYETGSFEGFNIARKFALLSYRNPNELDNRFHDKTALLKYLDYNAQKFTKEFDPNCYWYIFNAMDDFDVTGNYADPIEPFRKISAKALVISVSSDLLFPPQQQKELYEKLIAGGVDAKMIYHESNYGHDAFYADDTIREHLKLFL